MRRQKQHFIVCFERYWQVMIGTPETTEKQLSMKNIGVDEIACLTDFGLKFDSVMRVVSFERFKEECQAKKS